MKLKLDIDPDIAAMMQAEFLAGERAVTAAMRQAGGDLKADWRRAASATRPIPNAAKVSMQQRSSGRRPQRSSMRMTRAC